VGGGNGSPHSGIRGGWLWSLRWTWSGCLQGRVWLVALVALVFSALAKPALFDQPKEHTRVIENSHDPSHNPIRRRRESSFHLRVLTKPYFQPGARPLNFAKILTMVVTTILVKAQLLTPTRPVLRPFRDTQHQSFLG